MKSALETNVTATPNSGAGKIKGENSRPLFCEEQSKFA